jgi:hypothetical protein
VASEANNVIQAPAAIAGVQTPAHEGAAKSFWRILRRFDSSKLQPYLGLRNAAGVVLPLIVGYGQGMPRGGLAVASGALNVWYSDGSDGYATRAKRMFLSSVLRPPKAAASRRRANGAVCACKCGGRSHHE